MASSLSDLFDTMGPGYGALNTGFNQGQQQQATALENLLKATQVQRGGLDNQFDEANLPTRIQQSAANLQATVGQNQTRDLSNQFTTATQPGAISATDSNNALVPTTNMAKEQQEKLQMYTGLAAKFSAMTPTERMANANALLKQYPAIGQDPELDNIVANPDRALAGYKIAILNQPKAIDDANKATVQGTQRMQEINAQGDNAMAIARLKLDAAADLQRLKLQGSQDLASIAGKGGPLKAAAYAEAMSARETDPDKKSYWDGEVQRYRAMDATAAAARAPAVPQMTDGGGTLHYVPVPGNNPNGPAPLPNGGPRQDTGAASNADPLGIR